MLMTSWSTSGVYSYLYESGGDFIDLYAIRRVYPLSGFNILLEAYLKSISDPESLQIDAFIEDFAKEQYGLDPGQAWEFKQMLLAVPYEVSRGVVKDNGMSVSQLLDSARHVSTFFKLARPLRNKQEFEHYRVISDTRLQYLIYQDIEARANESDITADQLPQLIHQLRTVIQSTKVLNKKYISLNRKVFYSSELEQDNQLRIIKMQLLYERLSRKR
jgi:hypothetical protein